MNRNEFSEIRRRLGRTQNQMAQLLGTSIKAVQSFEQGWRNIPVHIERQALFLLAHQRSPDRNHRDCWTIQKCPIETRRACPAWEFQIGHLCWFINGTVCHGKVQGSWREKMEICRRCGVFQLTLPDIFEPLPPGEPCRSDGPGDEEPPPGLGTSRVDIKE